MERFITLSSDFNDYYIKEFNTELEYVEKFGEIKIDLLEKTYNNHEQREMSHWVPRYICEPDKVNFTYNSNEFKEHIINSKWTNDEPIDGEDIYDLRHVGTWNPLRNTFFSKIVDTYVLEKVKSHLDLIKKSIVKYETSSVKA